MNIPAVLKTSSVFAALDDAALERIAALTTETRYGAEETIFNENDPADAFYLIAEGEVVISRRLGKEQKVLAVLEAGSVFGEMAFFAGSPRTADARTRAACTLLKIAREKYSSFVAGDVAAGTHVLSGLLRIATQRLEETSRELATVYQTGNIISRGTALKETVQSLRAQLLLSVPEADDAAIFLYNEFNRDFDPAAAREGAHEIAFNDPIAAFASQVPMGAISDGSIPFPVIHGLTDAAQSAIYAPFFHNEMLLGFILLWNENKANAFKRSTLLLTFTVGTQLAGAVENMRHRQEEQDRERLQRGKF